MAILPTLALTPAPFAAAFAGTLGVSAPKRWRRCSRTWRTGSPPRLRRMVVRERAPRPGAPRRGTRRRSRRSRADGLRVAFPDLTRKPWARRLGEEFTDRRLPRRALRDLDRAGRAAGPGARRPDATPAQSAARSRRRSARAQTTFEEAGGPRAYFGWPADATADEGRTLVDALGAILEEAALPLLADD